MAWIRLWYGDRTRFSCICSGVREGLWCTCSNCIGFAFGGGGGSSSKRGVENWKIGYKSWFLMTGSNEIVFLNYDAGLSEFDLRML